MSNPILIVKDAGRGETPHDPDARFQVGDVVNLRKRKHLIGLPPEAVVIGIVPGGFPPEYALADLLGEPRPLMITVPGRARTYILAREGDPKAYLLKEPDLVPSSKPRVEIGSVRREAAE